MPPSRQLRAAANCELCLVMWKGLADFFAERLLLSCPPSGERDRAPVYRHGAATPKRPLGRRVDCSALLGFADVSDRIGKFAVIQFRFIVEASRKSLPRLWDNYR